MKRARHAIYWALAGTLFACSGEAITDLGTLSDGKTDFEGIENVPISVPPADSEGPGSVLFRVEADRGFRVVAVQDTDFPMSVVVEGPVGEERSEPAVSIDFSVTGPPSGSARFVITIRNHGDDWLSGRLSLKPNAVVPDDSELPSLSDDVVMENEFCVYQNQQPYVKEVKWDNPAIARAMSSLGPGWRSTFSYYDWRYAYGLESENASDPDEARNARVRNFIRVLCGEFRDYPEMMGRKLDVVTNAQVYAGPDEMETVNEDGNLFSQITYPAYRKMINAMRVMHSYRQGLVRDDNDGYVYNDGANGDYSGRVENSVPPWTHCEMKFMFATYMVAGAPQLSTWGNGDKPEDYERKFAEYQEEHCSPEDFAWMYNFRGHKNFKPLWLESNGFIWNSRRARTAATKADDESYYERPFAHRLLQTKQLLASYLFYRDEHAEQFGEAYASGGGPILYITDQDGDGDNVADYRLFDEEGCGDNGVGSTNPSYNCNMVDWDTAAETESTTGHTAGWNPDWFALPDMGFMQTFTTFEQRMARFNQALDRHTNWGPTGYYMLDASGEEAAPNQVKFIGAYSPIVACSYDISASDAFASGDYPSTDPFESGHTKWMYIMRFPTRYYYDEKDMKNGEPFDFYRAYFNETSLSNDYYHERALDRFGFVPPGDVYANVYFVYGSRGEEPPPLEEIPAP